MMGLVMKLRNFESFCRRVQGTGFFQKAGSLQTPFI